MHQGPGVTVLLPFRRLSPHLPRVIQLWLVGWRGLGDRMARWQGEWHKMTEGVREREEEGRKGGGWGGRWWWWGGGYTVEQKNYRALIAGTSLETETREWGGFTAPIISSPAPPHRSPARTRDGEEERESEMERERVYPAWEAPSSPIRSNDLSTDLLCALRVALPRLSPFPAHAFISICCLFLSLQPPPPLPPPSPALFKCRPLLASSICYSNGALAFKHSFPASKFHSGILRTVWKNLGSEKWLLCLLCSFIYPLQWWSTILVILA